MRNRRGKLRFIMGIAPPPQLAACLEVIYRATLSARILGYEGHEHGLTPRDADHLAELMDAIHNIPYLIANWERCNESLLRGMLQHYDSRWTASLLETYDSKLAEQQAR